MFKKITLLFSFLIVLFLGVSAQCGTTAIPGNYTISTNTTLNAGTYNVTGDFTVAAGVTLTVNYTNGCAFIVNATNITIAGTINANGAGNPGGTGGGAGSSSGGAGGGSLAHGGGGGNAGSGTGGGNVGNTGGNATGGCNINCGTLCINGNDADRAGGGGGAGGSGGSFGGAGGIGGGGANGREENEPGNSRCGSTPVPGNGATGNNALSVYNTTADASNLPTGSGGGGAGAGGGGYTNGTGGSAGGTGGGSVNLNATGNLTVGGVITANGTTGGAGGNGGVRSGGGDYNCDACSNNNGGGSNTCRDASSCGACTYYTWGWPGGAGAGAGGGSGGGIKLQAIGVMSITGALTANGGSGGNAGSPKISDGSCNHYASGGGAGGGGIIKLVYDPCANNTFTPTTMAANAGTPGTGTDGNISSNTAAAGIVYNQSANIYFPGYTPFTTPTISANQTLCSGNTPAGLTSANVSGGTGTYNYQWFSSTTNPLGQTGSSSTPATGYTAITGATGATLSSATIGAISTTTYYQLLVQSGPCSVWTNVVTITITPVPIINSATAVNVLCNGGSTGSITVSLAGGTQPYSYSDNGGASYQTGNNVFSNLNSGSYNIYAKDANGCPVVYGANPVVITQPALLTQTDSAISASCGNVNDGSIIVTAGGGTAPYQYSLNGGSNQPGNTFFGLSASTYSVQVTDANGCASTATVTVNAAYSVTASLVNKTNVSCFGGSDGSATLQLTGGVPPYSYSINGVTFQNGPTFVGLTAGNYVGTIKDSHGCTDFVLVQITQPNLFQVQIDTLTNVSCNGSATGAIYIGVTGGTAPYSFHWSSNDSTQDLTNLTAGTYNVTVVDAKGCNSYAGATVNQPLALFVNIASYHNLKCFNDSTGSIETAASGGTPPYAFAWSNSSTYQNIYALQQGTYTLTVHDANGCVDTLSQALTQPTQLVPTISGTNATCGNTLSGAVNFSLSGGTPPYSYIWNNGASSESLSNVAGGTYLVNAHDADGCVVIDTTTITGAASPIVANLATVSPTCHGTNTGTIIAVVTGGVEPYTYAWSTTPTRTTAAINNLQAGIYTLTVVDGIGCSVAVTDTLSQTDSLTVNANVNGAKCFNTSSGSVVASTTGGIPPFTYLVNGVQQTTDTFSNLSAGNYSVLVIDANGCQATSSFVVSSPSAFSVKLTLTDQSILTGQQTQLIATPTSSSPVLNYFWSPIVENGTDLFTYGCADTLNCATPYVKPPFTTTFTVQMMNADSCIATDTITINVTNQPVSFIPNAFTPNNDGLNDRFQFAILGANTTEVSIFNRWGEKVFYNASQTNSTAATDGWDGTIKSKPAPEDSYVYQLKVTYFDGTVKTIAGTVTLMR